MIMVPENRKFQTNSSSNQQFSKLISENWSSLYLTKFTIYPPATIGIPRNDQNAKYTPED